MMSRRLLLGVAPLLAATALLSVPQTSQAQWVGFGGRNFSIGIGSPYYGGYGYSPGWYGYNSTWYGGYPYVARSYWGGGYYPYYGSYYNYPYYSNSYYYPTPVVNAYSPTTGYQSFYPQATDTEQNSARMRLRVPENARVWFDNTETQQRGMDREFVSPALTPGKSYVYQIKAQWQENGRDVTRQRQVTVRAGEAVNVDLLADAAAPRDDAAPATNNNVPRDRDAGQPPKPALPADPEQPRDKEKPRENPAAVPDR